MDYKELVQLYGFSLKRGMADAWIRAKYGHVRNSYPFFAEHACAVCGRKPDFVYHFATLTPVFFKRLKNGWWINSELGILLEQGQAVMDVCEQHGQLGGSIVTDCHTGEPMHFKPRQWHYPALNLIQGFVLHASIYLRWLWFYLAYIYNWQIGYRIAWCRKYYAKK